MFFALGLRSVLFGFAEPDGLPGAEVQAGRLIGMLLGTLGSASHVKGMAEA